VWLVERVAQHAAGADRLRRATQGEFGTYLHIPVLYLEQSGLREVLGPVQAQKVFVTRPFYTAITALVLDQFDAIGQVLHHYGLTLPEKPPSVRTFAEITLTGSQAKQQ
jgi:hypothetical protein